MNRLRLASIAVLLAFAAAEARPQPSAQASPEAGAIASFPLVVPVPKPPPDELDSRLQAQIEKLVDERLKAKQQQDDADKKQQDEVQAAVGGTAVGANVVWRNGFWLQTPNKSFTFHLMGIVQYDYVNYMPQSNLTEGPHRIDFQDGANPRRIRVRGEGTMWDCIDYRLELEFANGVLPVAAGPDVKRANYSQTFLTPGPTDAWFTVKQLPLINNVRVGNQKEPISLEHLEGFRWLPFMERSILFDFDTATAFNNGFNPGIMAFDTCFDERMTWALGIFRHGYYVYGFSVGAGQFAGTGRLTWLPYYADEGRYLIHVGGSLSDRDPVDNEIRFRIRPSVRNAPAPLTPFVPIMLDTGFFGTSNQRLANLEYFMNIGSFTLQAEYLNSWTDNTIVANIGDIGTTHFEGAYVQALYWLTGEYTRWDKKAAAPDRYNVNAPFRWRPGCGPTGCGAWQVGARYSWVNLNSLAVNGGALHDITLGLNWYLNNNVRMQFNYVYEHRTGLVPHNSDGNLNGFGMRAQVDF
jgi:phosphate-selective porin OprO/OprP